MKLKYLLPVVAGFAVLGAATAQATAPSFTAVVDNTGTLARGYHAVGAMRTALGRYQVTFSRDVSACSYTASVGLPGNSGSELFGTVSVAPRAGKPKAIFVQTFEIGGAPADRGFHVIVAC